MMLEWLISVGPDSGRFVAGVALLDQLATRPNHEPAGSAPSRESETYGKHHQGAP